MGLLDGQAAVVTGGGSGIGRATCRRMAAGGRPGGRPRRRRGVGGGRGPRGRRVRVRRRRWQPRRAASRRRRGGGALWAVSPSSTTTRAPPRSTGCTSWTRPSGSACSGSISRGSGRASAPPRRTCWPAVGGSIVSTASISGTRPAAGEGPYAASKAAVAALTASAAFEYGPVDTGERGVARA